MSKQIFETLRCQSEGPVLRVTLARPEVLNAINGRMLAEVRDTLTLALNDAAVRVVVIDSACEKAFSAGIDVAYVKDLDNFAIREVGRELHRTFLALRVTEKPIIAVVDGLCLGAGLELAISCDMILASERSRFGLPNIHRGIPAIVEAAILPMAVGIQGAREMAYLGEFWDAAKAERRGLVTALAPASGLAELVRGYTEKLATKSPAALATQKEIIHKWMTTDLESAIDFSVNTVVLNFATRDQKDAMATFLERRHTRPAGG